MSAFPLVSSSKAPLRTMRVIGFAVVSRAHWPPACVKSASSLARSKPFLRFWYTSVGMMMPTSPRLSLLIGSRPRTPSAIVSSRNMRFTATRAQNPGTRHLQAALKTNPASSSLFDRSFSPWAIIGNPSG